MNIHDFDYDLPKHLIAQEPLARRDSSRLLVVDRKKKTLEDRVFHEIADLISPGDALVLNNTKVFPARILGKKKLTEGKVDLLLIEPYVRKASDKKDEYLSMGEAEEMAEKKIWRCLVQPVLKEGQEIVFSEKGAEARFLKRDTEGIPLIEFLGVDDVEELASKIGSMPLPPYIKRESAAEDAETYQTVYAKKSGAIAAPTAGLHFTEELLDKIRKKGAEVIFVTLHVGYGTFKPVEDLEKHKMHSERFELTKETAAKINAIKEKGGKIWAVGTTALRVLETCVLNKSLIAGAGETDLFIKEPFEFEIVDHLITNFHLPKTTLLLLISALMGEPLRKKSYAHAIAKEYRFYSYGDAMVIL